MVKGHSDELWKLRKRCRLRHCLQACIHFLFLSQLNPASPVSTWGSGLSCNIGFSWKLLRLDIFQDGFGRSMSYLTCGCGQYNILQQVHHKTENDISRIVFCLLFFWCLHLSDHLLWTKTENPEVFGKTSWSKSWPLHESTWKGWSKGVNQ